MSPFVDHGTVLPRLSRAQAPLTREILAVNEFGETERLSIPAERALTVYVDKRELVTLMTLGAHPELLVLGYLRNQRLLTSPFDIDSITVDWDVGAAAVKTHRGIDRIEEKTAKRVVTTGCGQGSVFGELMDEIDGIELPPATLSQAQLYGIVNAIRLQESTYKSAGSVHGCALFRGEEMLVFVEDVGRHNAIDTIAGWMWMRQEAPTLGHCVCGARGLARNGPVRRRQGVLHHGPADQRDGDQVRADGRADRGLAQRHHADGPRGGPAPGPVRRRPGHEPALRLLRGRRAPATAAGAGRAAPAHSSLNPPPPHSPGRVLRCTPDGPQPAWGGPASAERSGRRRVPGRRVGALHMR
jgi:formate dehydrogenase accessory protein FdhD